MIRVKKTWCETGALSEKCPNTELFLVRIFPHSDWRTRSICIQSECRKIRTRNNSIFGHFSRSGIRNEHRNLRLSARTFSYSVCNTAQKMKFSINPNQSGGQNTSREKHLPPWYILLNDFLVTHPNFIKFGDFSQNLSGINMLNFFKIQTGFCSVSTFSQPGVIFCVCLLLE